MGCSLTVTTEWVAQSLKTFSERAFLSPGTEEACRIVAGRELPQLQCASCGSSTKSRGSISLVLSAKHKTPLANVMENQASVCLGAGGVWSLFALKAWSIFLTWAKASHEICLPEPEAAASTWEGVEFAVAL